MTIAVGDKIPNATLHQLGAKGPAAISTDEIFKGKKVVIFAVPGAFTPTCSNAHLPGYVVKADDFFNKGVDTIACVSVNDPFVMAAWGEQQNAEKILMLADGNCSFTKAVGISLDLSVAGLGTRSGRYAMIVDDGVVTALNVEEATDLDISDAESMLALL